MASFLQNVPAWGILAATAVAGIIVVQVLGLFRPKAVKPFLERRHNSVRRRVKLVEKEALSHDVYRFRFILPTPNTPFGLPRGKHIKVFGPNCRDRVVPGEWNGRPDKETDDEIERKYSPVTDSLGHFDLMLKVYAGGEKERFPDGGKMSQYLKALDIGQEIEIAGPCGHVTYEGTFAGGASRFKVGSRITDTTNLGFIAGGTGLTPILRIINAILHDRSNRTHISLLFANQTEEDIFLRQKLDALQDEFPEQFHVWYTLDRPPEDWKYSSGFINSDMIAEQLPRSDGEGNPFVMMCGPPPMIKFACVPNLEKLGFEKTQYVSF